MDIRNLTPSQVESLVHNLLFAREQHLRKINAIEVTVAEIMAEYSLAINTEQAKAANEAALAVIKKVKDDTNPRTPT